MIRSETAVPKPRLLTIPNVQGGARTLIVANLGPSEENGSYRVTLTASGNQVVDSRLQSAATSPVWSRLASARKPRPRSF